MFEVATQLGSRPAPWLSRRDRLAVWLSMGAAAAFAVLSPVAAAASLVTGLAVSWLLRRQLCASERALGDVEDAVRDLEVGAGLGIERSAACGDVVEAIGECAGRLRRATQRHLSRVAALDQQLLDAERSRDSDQANTRNRSNFLANMCHEIRTPLNGLLGFLTMLSESALDAQQREWVGIARGSGEALLALLNDVLDLAKIDAGKLTLEKVDFDRDELLENVACLFAPTAQAKGVELLLSVDAKLPPRMLGDPVRLRQVIANLVGNAVKFTSQGEVLVQARLAHRVGARIVLEIDVCDTGVGIPPERLPRLFAAFEQAEVSTSRRFGGSGLGLAIVKRIVEQMAGEISVQSEPGRGSRFIVRVPLMATPSDVPAPSATRVVLVDPHQRRREIALQNLSALAQEVVAVADTEAALAALAAVPTTVRAVVLQDDALAVDPRVVQATHRLDGRLFVVRPVPTAHDAVADGVDGVLTRPIRRAVLAAALGKEPREAVARSVVAPQNFEGARVLLVEDNAVNQRLMCALLARVRAEVVVAGNGRQAIEAVARYPFDLILMDVQMPEMDGLEATRAIRRSEVDGRRVPIVALTANAQSGDREQCLAAGMDDYLTKPVRAAALHGALARWLVRACMGS